MTKLIQLKVGGTKLKYGIKDKDQLCNLPTNLLWSTNKANQINYENWLILIKLFFFKKVFLIKLILKIHESNQIIAHARNNINNKCWTFCLLKD